MSVLTRPRHPLVETALGMARQWCEGRTIDGAPALAHAVQVALKLGEHLPDAPPALVAAALVHDSPQYAPSQVRWDNALTVALGDDVRDVVAALEREHHTLDAGSPELPPLDNMWTIQASAADKIVSLTSILSRAAAAEDPDEFWRVRQPFIRLVPYFHRFQQRTAGVLPASMARELGRLVQMAQEATCGPATPPPAATPES
jgi:hypothetical protein